MGRYSNCYRFDNLGYLRLILEIKDTYRTLEVPSSEVLFKDRNSKFYGYAYPINTEDQVKTLIETLKKKHHSARHWCYAWQLGTKTIRFRANDDGEPNNSAGQPIYGQIQSFDLTNVLIVVVRYFGGVKLGVGGLINAYRSAAQLALEESTIVEKTIDVHYRLIYDYKLMNKVMQVIKKKQLTVLAQELTMHCELIIQVRLKDADEVYSIFDHMHEVEIKIEDQ